MQPRDWLTVTNVLCGSMDLSPTLAKARKRRKETSAVQINIRLVLTILAISVRQLPVGGGHGVVGSGSVQQGALG